MDWKGHLEIVLSQLTAQSRGQLQQVAKTHISTWAFNISNRLHSLSGQLYQCFISLTCLKGKNQKNKKINSLTFKWNFQFVSIAYSLDIIDKSLFYDQIFIHIDNISGPSLLLTVQSLNRLTQSLLIMSNAPFLYHFHYPFLDLNQYVFWDPGLDPLVNRGKGNSLGLLVILFLM